MAGIKSRIQTNRRLLYFIAGLLVVIAFFVTKSLYDQKNENRALRLKILTLSDSRRATKPWTQLISPAKLVADSASLINSSAATEARVSNETSSTSSALSLAEQDIVAIALKLDKQMREVQSLDLNTLDENISLAEEIISREPDSYDAYKAKLISMLVKEGKFNQSISDNEVNDLLESMAQFSPNSEDLALREAAYNSTANLALENIENTLSSITAERATLEERLETLPADSPDRAPLIASLQALEQEAMRAESNLEAAQAQQSLSSGQLANLDLIDISFKRMIAQGDFEAAADNAQGIIDSYPSSPEGYFYLVRSLQLQGEGEQARSMLESANLSPELRDSLLQRLSQERSQNPQDYWKNLKF